MNFVTWPLGLRRQVRDWCSRSRGIDRAGYVRYLREVYGDDVPLGAALPPHELDVLYADLWRAHVDPKIDSWGNNACPGGEADTIAYLHNMSGTNDPPNTVWLYHPPPYASVPSGAWVEVVHCANSIAQLFEERGYWCYKASGSGVWLNVGRSIAFDSHQQGVQHFLGRAVCTDINGIGECEGDFLELVETAIRAASVEKSGCLCDM